MALVFVTFLWFAAVNAVNICPNQERECNREGECCSKWGFCGVGDVYCGEGNRYDFGDDNGCPECICDIDCSTCNEEEEPPSGSPTIPPQPFDDNCNCFIYGDPHTKMWNCATNNWQGPHESDPLDVYYMTRCNGKTLNDMPFDLIGVIQRYDSYFTSLDYTILKLYAADGLEYCIRNKGSDGVSYNNDCSDEYTIIPNQNEVINLVNEFEILWKFEGGYSKLFVRVLNKFNECSSEEEEEYDLILTTQTVLAINGIIEEAIEIRVSQCYKPYTCGMCGDMYNTGLNFQISDGTIIELDAGAWGGTANDETGLTYAVDYDDNEEEPITTETPQRRIMIDTTQNIIGEPCFGLRKEIESECHTQLRQHAECCWDRREFCDDIIVSCGWDSCSCVMGKSHNITHALIENTVGMCTTAVLNASMTFVCGLPSDSFIVPDMSIYEKNVESDTVNNECKEGNITLNIGIGIIIGFVVFAVVAIFVYLLLIKRKLNEKQIKVRSKSMEMEYCVGDGETHNTQSL
eukprot:498789_1